MWCWVCILGGLSWSRLVSVLVCMLGKESSPCIRMGRQVRSTWTRTGTGKGHCILCIIIIFITKTHMYSWRLINEGSFYTYDLSRMWIICVFHLWQPSAPSTCLNGAKPQLPLDRDPHYP